MAIALKRIADSGDEVAWGVNDPCPLSIDIDRVATRAGSRTEVQCSAGNLDGRVAIAAGFLHDVVTKGQVAAHD